MVHFIFYIIIYCLLIKKQIRSKGLVQGLSVQKTMVSHTPEQFFFMVKKHQSQTLPLATINVFWGQLTKSSANVCRVERIEMINLFIKQILCNNLQ